MKIRSKLSKAVVAFVVLAPAVAMLSGASPAPNAAPQSGSAQVHCVTVGGSIMTNLGVIDQNTTIGTVTGDLRGAVSATLLSVTPEASGSLKVDLQHHWITESGEVIFFAPVSSNAVPTAQPGIFGVTFDPLKITGGTGKFNGASGALHLFGAVDFNAGQTTFRYSGQVCFAAAD